MSKKLLLIDKELEEVLAFTRQFANDGEDVTFKVGEYGMLLFHRLLNTSKKPFVILNQSVTSKDIKNDGVQFISYKVDSDISYVVELIHDPSLDDRNLHWEVDLATGFLISSSTLYKV